jgi:hypothetical protein
VMVSIAVVIKRLFNDKKRKMIITIRCKLRSQH